ncbi:MAG: C25 family cysteine peptidase [Candidatus Cloacimonadales bacterium]
MKKTLILIFLVFVISLNADWISLQEVANQQLFSTDSRSLQTTEILFELDGFELEEIEEEGKVFTKISYPEAGEWLDVGKPDLPRFTRLIAIPASGGVELQVEAQEFEVRQDVAVYPRQALQSESQPYDRSFQIDREYYQKGSLFPAENITLGQPAIFRDYRIVAVTVNPFQYDASKRELKIVKKVNIIVNSTTERSTNEMRSTAKKSRYFDTFYQSTILNYAAAAASRDEFQTPSYLIIYNHNNNNDVLNLINQLAEWKHQKGFEVNAVSVNTIGTSTTAIKNYIQDAYDTWENRPEFVTFIGDANGSYNIPTYTETWSSYNGEGDHPYSQLEGDDVLADVATGRLSFETPIELATIINKTINYEKAPYIAEPAWFEQAAFFGDPSTSGQSCVDTKIGIKEMMNAAKPNIAVDEYYSGSWVSNMSNSINNGISYFNYRGFAGMSSFYVDNINDLNNGPQLPFAAILTCGTGSFASGTSRSEAFLRAGSPTIPKGAIGSVGTATMGTHTTFNNCVDTGMFYGIFAEENYSMGMSLLRGKLNLYLTYPDNPNNKVDIFSHWNTLMGDPGLELWTGVPEELDVTYSSNLSLGTNYLQVEVKDASGLPLEDAWVTALQGDDIIFSTDFTDANGLVTLPVANGEEGSVELTVTAHDFMPHLGEFTIGEAANSVVMQSYEILDPSGNNDGWANPGETVTLQITAQNMGSSTANNISAELSSLLAGITFDTATASFGNITAGSTATADFQLTLADDVLGSSELKMQIDFSAGSSDYIFMPVLGAALMIDEVYCEIDPGATENLSLQLYNLGGLDLNNVTATLVSNHDFITVEDDQGSFALILAGDTAINSTDDFLVHCNNTALPGTQYNLQVNLTNPQGFDQTLDFYLEVGEVAVTDPLGPDAGGYVAYDIGDTGYYQAPVYDWIEISSIGTALNLSDSGNMGDTEDVLLPFDFQFYGVVYDEITICSNGWIAPGTSDSRAYMNWIIPGPDGPSPMIAPFWDDLLTSSGDVYYHYDTSNNYFVIQWENLKNEYNNSSIETFQVILYDPIHYHTPSGNGNIKFQYKEFANVDAGSYSGGVAHGCYATIGIEDHTATRGLGYSYYNQYPTAALPLGDETAIFFTDAPIPLNEPYLIVGGVEIEDDEQLDFGETVDFELLVENLGENPATNVTATISSDDPYITINNATADYGDIYNTGTGYNLTPFNITLAENCPDLHAIPFTVDISSDEDDWQLSFTILGHAPLINLQSTYINDGDNNILDAGETAEIMINLENMGSSMATDVLLELTLDDEYVSINATEYDLGNIAAGSSATALFEVSANEDTPIGHQAVLEWAVSGDNNYSNWGVTSIVVSQIPVQVEEYFDTFPPAGWVTEGIDGGGNWDGSDSNNAGGTAPEAKLNWSPSFNGEQRLVGPIINTLGSSTLNLEFKHYLNDFGGSDYVLGLKSTSDGGESWNTIWEISPTSDINAVTIELEVDTPDVGSEEFQIAFYLNGNSYNINYWFIDDVIISGGSGAVLGFVQGQAELSGAGDITDVLISVGDYTAQPNSAGEYFLAVEPGSYQFTASLDGYETFSQDDLEVNYAETTTVDFTLEEIENILPPANLNALVNEANVQLSWDEPLARQADRSASKAPKTKDDGNSYRDLLGYKIYRDGAEIAELSELIYIDEDLENGSYEYYVTALYDGGESVASNQIEVVVDYVNSQDFIPLVTALNGNYPNPFNPETTISFDLHQDDTVEIQIYNIKGQKVKTLLHDFVVAGQHQIMWNGLDNKQKAVSSGVYFYKMQTSSYHSLGKMILLK